MTWIQVNSLINSYTDLMEYYFRLYIWDGIGHWNAWSFIYLFGMDNGK